MKVLLINMDKDTERLERMKIRLKGIDFERVPGVYNETAYLGCAMSHKKCWDLVKEPTLILEDDCIFDQGFFDKVANFELPACDVFLWGYNNTTDGTHKSLQNSFWPRRKHVDHGEYFEPEMFGGLHCYVVTPSGAEHLKQVEPDYHMDFKLCKEPLKIFAYKESIATQETIDPGKGRTLLTHLAFCIRDKYNVPLSYPWAANISRNITGWHIVYFIAGLISLPIVIFTADRRLWEWYIVGCAISRKILSLIRL